MTKDIFSQIDEVATSSARATRYFNWTALPLPRKGVEATIGQHQFMVFEQNGLWTAAMIHGTNIQAHKTTDSRTAKEWCWRKARVAGLLAPTPSAAAAAAAAAATPTPSETPEENAPPSAEETADIVSDLTEDVPEPSPEESSEEPVPAEETEEPVPAEETEEPVPAEETEEPAPPAAPRRRGNRQS